MCICLSVCVNSPHNSVHMPTYTPSLEKPVKPAGSAQFDPKQTGEEFGSEWSIKCTRTYSHVHVYTHKHMQTHAHITPPGEDVCEEGMSEFFAPEKLLRQTF